MTNVETPIPSPSPDTGFVLSDKLYARLKFLAMLFLPALATLYIALGNIWGWPNVEEVALSITAVDTFLGVLLGISTKSYNESDARFVGDIVVTRDAGGKMFSLETYGDPENLDQFKELTFKVVDPHRPVE